MKVVEFDIAGMYKMPHLVAKATEQLLKFWPFLISFRWSQDQLFFESIGKKDDFIILGTIGHMTNLDKHRCP